MDAARDRGRRLVPGPFLLVNPRSGGESATPAELVEEATRLGIEAHELEPGEDARERAAAAADAGASALGMAGGDGSLAAVAEVALERGLPFVCIPFGTRNHFARDLGIDREDPVAAVGAFRGLERRVDVGEVNGELFVNNVSLGVYAGFVHDPARKTRNRLIAFFRMVPAIFGRGRRPLSLAFDIEGERAQRDALVVLIANNGYSLKTMADLGSRARLDEGLLHAYVIEAVDRRALLALLARAARGRAEEAEGWAEWTARSFRVEFGHARIHAAIDGEPVLLEPPLDFAIRRGELRVLVPPSG